MRFSIGSRSATFAAPDARTCVLPVPTRPAVCRPGFWLCPTRWLSLRLAGTGPGRRQRIGRVRPSRNDASPSAPCRQRRRPPARNRCPARLPAAFVPIPTKRSGRGNSKLTRLPSISLFLGRREARVHRHVCRVEHALAEACAADGLRHKGPATAAGREQDPQRRWSALSLLRQCNRVRPQRAIMALTALLILAHAAVSGFVLARFRAHVLHGAAAELDNFGRSAGIAVGRSLFAASAVSFGVALAIAALPPAAPLDDPAIGALLRRFREQGSPFCTILLVDADGRLANAAGPAPAAMRNYAASPFFAAHLHKNAPLLFVGLTPETLPGGRSLIVSRPLYRGGRFAGVVAVAVPRAALADILQAVVGRTGVAAQILLDRGVVVAAEPRRPGAGARAVAAIKAFAGARESGRARASAAVSAGERQGVLYNVRTLAAFPVTVAVARPRADILRRWQRALIELLAGFGVFAATAVTLAGLIVRALNLREQAACELQRNEAQSRRQGALLQSTLESMVEGLSVFDRNGRLVAWNRRFCELLGLSSVALGMSLREILMQQAVRGDFGAVVPEAEVEKRIAEFYQTPQTKERVTPDGRVLQIRRTAMPDGAVLTIYWILPIS